MQSLRRLRSLRRRRHSAPWRGQSLRRLRLRKPTVPPWPGAGTRCQSLRRLRLRIRAPWRGRGQSLRRRRLRLPASCAWRDQWLQEAAASAAAEVRAAASAAVEAAAPAAESSFIEHLFRVTPRWGTAKIQRIKPLQKPKKRTAKIQRIKPVQKPKKLAPVSSGKGPNCAQG